MRTSRSILIVLITLVLVAVSMPGCSQQASPGKSEPSMPAKDVEVFFERVDLSISGTPLLNKPIELACIVTATPHVGSDSSIQILLPDGFELISGDLSWQGYIAKEQTVELKAIVRVIETGDWLIGAWAGPSWNPEYDRANLYVSVTEDGATVTQSPPRSNTLQRLIERLRCTTN